MDVADISTKTATMLRKSSIGDVIDGLKVVAVGAPRVVNLGLDCPMDSHVVVHDDQGATHWRITLRSSALYDGGERVTVRCVTRVRAVTTVDWVPA